MAEFDFVVKNGLVVNTTFTANSSRIALGSNLVVNTSTILVGNATANSSISPTAISTSNSTSSFNISPSTALIGNSTVNSSINSTSFQVANSTTTVSISPSTVLLGNTTVNSSISTTTIQVANASGNVQTTATSVLLQSNTTVNSSISPTLVSLANSLLTANLSPSSLLIGNTTVNSGISTTLIQVANASGNVQTTATSVLLQSNTTVNNNITPTSVILANSTSTANIGTGSISVGNATVRTTIQQSNAILAGTIAVNGSIGTVGQILTSGGGTNAYWSAAAVGTVTSVATSNGIAGGTITGSGTLRAVAASGIFVNADGIHVLANTGIVANATGTFVNATYIGSISSNNSTFLDGQNSSFYRNADNINAGTLAWARAPAGTVNTSGQFTFTNINTFNANTVFNGNVVLGSVGLSANNSLGTAGHVLHSNGSATYWAPDDNSGGTVTSVATGNGMIGGTITGTGTVSVLANTGIVANSTGTFVNATYIGAITANNTSFVGSVSAANVVSNAQLSANLALYAPLAGAAFTGNVTIGGNLIVTGTTLYANVTNLDVKDKNITVAYGAADAASTDGAGLFVDVSGASMRYTHASNTWEFNVGLIPSANNSWNLGLNTLRWQTVFANNITAVNISANGASVTSVNAAAVGGNTASDLRSYSDSIAGSAASSAAATAYSNAVSIAASDATSKASTAYSNAVTVAASDATSKASTAYSNAITIASNADNLTSGTISYARIPANIVNTTAAFTRTGITTFSANVILGSSGLSSNGSFGSAGQILYSNGSATYWSNATGGAYYKGNLGTVGTAADMGNLYRLNSNSMTSSITISAGENALTCGPINITSGQTLTIETGGRVVII